MKEAALAGAGAGVAPELPATAPDPCVAVRVPAGGMGSSPERVRWVGDFVLVLYGGHHSFWGLGGRVPKHAVGFCSAEGWLEVWGFRLWGFLFFEPLGLVPDPGAVSHLG